MSTEAGGRFAFVGKLPALTVLNYTCDDNSRTIAMNINPIEEELVFNLTDPRDILSTISGKFSINSLISISKNWSLFDNIDEVISFLRKLATEKIKPKYELKKPSEESSPQVVLTFKMEFASKVLSFPLQFERVSPEKISPCCERILAYYVNKETDFKEQVSKL